MSGKNQNKAEAEQAAIEKAEAEEIAAEKAEAEKAKAEKAANKKVTYKIAAGKSLVTKKGILTAGTVVKEEYFNNQESFKTLIDKKIIIK